MEPIPHPDEKLQAVSIKEQEPSIHEVASMIAQTLGETEHVALQQLQRIVWALGRTQSRQLLEQTIQIEENGGIMLQDGSRRRTPGGVFFHLAYTTGQPKEGRTLQRPAYKKPKKEKKEAPPVEPKKQFQSPLPKPVPQLIPLFTWNNRIPAVKEAMQEKGQATVKITVIGRPRQNCRQGHLYCDRDGVDQGASTAQRIANPHICGNQVYRLYCIQTMEKSRRGHKRSRRCANCRRLSQD